MNNYTAEELHEALRAMPCYYIDMGGRVVCELVKEFTFLKPNYRLEGSSWRMEGDFLAHDYSLYYNGKQIMSLSKKWFTRGDSYELDISDSRDEVLCLCIALGCYSYTTRIIRTAY